jgi:tRNA U34 5-carboxymethylaminomethyl modifying enzyme MnmG/GidA
MTRHRLSIDLGDQHEAWINICKKYKQRPSTMAREVLLDVMIGERANFSKIIEDLKKISHAEADKVIKQRVSLRADEIAALDRFAQIMEVKRHDALVMIIREFVANEPHFTYDEISAVQRSNRYMRMCTTNLNEMAKKINSLAKDEVYYDDIKSLITRVRQECRDLKQKVELHTKCVWNLFYTGRNRVPLIKLSKQD